MQEKALAISYLAKIQSAKDRGLEYSLSFSEFKKLTRRKTCFYTGIRFNSGKGLHRTMERLDNTKGYVTGNVVAVCHASNQLKAVIESDTNFLTDEVALKMLKKVVETKRKL